MKQIRWLSLALVLISAPVWAQSPPPVAGTIAALNGSVAALPGSYPSLAIQVTGTWTGTITFEGTTDDLTWVSVLATSVTDGSTATTTTSNGAWVIANGGYSRIRARMSASPTGTANVNIHGGLAQVKLASPVYNIATANTHCLSNTTKDSYWQEVAANDPGLYTDGANCAGGTLRLDVTSVRALFAVPIYVPSGSASAPTLTFSTQANTGIYKTSTGIGFAVTGSQVGAFDSGTFGLVLDKLSMGVTTGDVQLTRAAGGHLLVAGNKSVQVATSQTTPPVCYVNCGTSVPAVVGSDTDMIVTMGSGGTPASAFQVGFTAGFAAAPSCVGQMAKAGMANTKTPLIIVATTGGFTVTTNGASPSTSDVYNFHCFGVQ